jgi:lipoprotein-releasing system permease protein
MTFTRLLAVATRYTFALRGGYLSTFLSLLSILGIVLAIALLVVVLSVMNGFDREMRDHILGIVPQLMIKSYLPVEDWRAQAELLGEHPEVLAVAPYVQFEGMFVHRGEIDTALVNGLSLLAEEQLGALQRVLDAGARQRFADQPEGLLLGAAMARRLGAEVGDRLTLIVPESADRQRAARFAYLQVSGFITTGTELDESAAFIHLERAASLAGIEGSVHGFRLELQDLFGAPRIGWELVNEMPAGYYASDWTMTHGNLYAAIQLSRNMIGVLLFSVIAIAAFNVVSSLVLVVIDKHSDIAILRALGATPSDINGIFLLQGLMIALVGASIGSSLGVLGSLWVTDAVAWLESLFAIKFLTTDVYPIDYLPSDLRWSDLLAINAVTFMMCFLAALYPARRAAKLPPADALRHE